MLECLRRRVWTGALCAMLLTTAAAAATGVPADLRTPAERSAYRTTPDYDETLRYIRTLAARSPWIHLTTYGTSAQGRPLPLVILSRDRAFTPELAHRAAKPVILIQNGIHSGEIEGKDACLALIRDICVTRRYPTLLDHATVLILPILSVDAHERRSSYNRINQNGPENMGWRSNAQGLNLNRDYMKLETPELRALIGNVFITWWPDLLVDDHTTDGADYQHDVTYGIAHGPTLPQATDRWLREAFEGRVIPRLASMGHLPAPYLSFRDGTPRSGIEFGGLPPRFSTAYAPLQGRPAILVETHMLKPYAARVQATYDLLLALLQEINARPVELREAVRRSEEEIAGRVHAPLPAGRQVALTSATTGAADSFAFHGRVVRYEHSDITGGLVPRYGSAPWDTTIALFRDLAPQLTIEEPQGYLVPREWAKVRDRLDLHGVRYRVLAAPYADSADVVTITGWKAGGLSEGHHPIEVTGVRHAHRWTAWRAGDLWVPLDQPRALVAVHLLEAEAPDGLLRWNVFDTIFEHKEYAEDYVFEPIARQMLRDSPALADSFAAAVAADSVFARNPDARLDWLYRRSRWSDPLENVMPVARALRPVPEAVLVPRPAARRRR